MTTPKLLAVVLVGGLTVTACGPVAPQESGTALVSHAALSVNVAPAKAPPPTRIDIAVLLRKMSEAAARSEVLEKQSPEVEFQNFVSDVKALPVTKPNVRQRIMAQGTHLIGDLPAIRRQSAVKELDDIIGDPTAD